MAKKAATKKAKSLKAKVSDLRALKSGTKVKGGVKLNTKV
jgi:hypothetical protein